MEGTGEVRGTDDHHTIHTSHIPEYLTLQRTATAFATATNLSLSASDQTAQCTRGSHYSTPPTLSRPPHLCVGHRHDHLGAVLSDASRLRPATNHETCSNASVENDLRTQSLSLLVFRGKERCTSAGLSLAGVGAAKVLIDLLWSTPESAWQCERYPVPDTHLHERVNPAAVRARKRPPFP